MQITLKPLGLHLVLWFTLVFQKNHFITK